MTTRRPRLYVWDPAFASGIAEIDDEHQQFFDILNEIYAATIAGEFAARAAVALDRIKVLAARHFETEERLFAASRYPDAEDHRRMHAAFTDALETMPVTAESARAMLAFMRDWLVTHMLRADRKFARWYAESRVGGAPRRGPSPSRARPAPQRALDTRSPRLAPGEVHPLNRRPRG